MAWRYSARRNVHNLIDIHAAIPQRRASTPTSTSTSMSISTQPITPDPTVTATPKDFLNGGFIRDDHHDHRSRNYHLQPQQPNLRDDDGLFVPDHDRVIDHRTMHDGGYGVQQQHGRGRRADQGTGPDEDMVIMLTSARNNPPDLEIVVVDEHQQRHAWGVHRQFIINASDRLAALCCDRPPPGKATLELHGDNHFVRAMHIVREIIYLQAADQRRIDPLCLNRLARIAVDYDLFNVFCRYLPRWLEPLGDGTEDPLRADYAPAFTHLETAWKLCKFSVARAWARVIVVHHRADHHGLLLDHEGRRASHLLGRNILPGAGRLEARVRAKRRDAIGKVHAPVKAWFDDPAPTSSTGTVACGTNGDEHDAVCVLFAKAWVAARLSEHPNLTNEAGVIFHAAKDVDDIRCSIADVKGALEKLHRSSSHAWRYLACTGWSGVLQAAIRVLSADMTPLDHTKPLNFPCGTATEPMLID